MYIPENPNTIGFIYKNIYHSVLNCYESTDMSIKYELSLKKPDMVHMITNNKDIAYFNNIGQVLARELMSSVTITNYSKFGGTIVFIPFKEKYKQIVSEHKGSENIHIHKCYVDIQKLKNKRYDNLDDNYRQNPPYYYYKNIRG